MTPTNRRKGAQRQGKRPLNFKVWLLVGVAAAGICLGGATGQALGVAPHFLLVSHSEAPTIKVQARPTPPLAEAVPPSETPFPEATPPPVETVPPRETPSPEVTPPPAERPGEEDWNLLLVNPWTPLPDGYEAELTQLKNGQAVDSRCYPDLQAMMDACRAEGLSPLICSSYRTQEKQESLFTRQVDKLVARGYSKSEAEEEAGKSVAVPGTSEHQLGLAVDIVDINNQNLNESQEDTPVQKWLMEHCWEYGFILRYPQGKSEVTGIIYEPWHYRYVGKTAALAIKDAECCLEEYLEK